MFTVALLTDFSFILQCMLYSFVLYYENANIVSVQTAQVVQNN